MRLAFEWRSRNSEISITTYSWHQFLAPTSKYFWLVELLYGKFPVEMHLPGHSFMEPCTQFDLRMNPDDTPKILSKRVDIVDNAALSLRHDLAYAQYSDTVSRNVADKEMVDELNSFTNLNPLNSITNPKPGQLRYF